MTSQSDDVSVCDVDQAVGQKATVLSTPALPDCSFPRSARLLTGRDYSQVFRRNQRFSDRYWTILVRRSDSATARLGLAIAKKRAKRAVDRNRMKRVAREAFRQYQSNLNGFELVVMNRDGAQSATAAELRQGIDKLLNKMTRTSLKPTRKPKQFGT